MTEEEKAAAAAAALQAQPPTAGDRKGMPTHLQSRAAFQPKTLDVAKRTVEIVFSVGARGLRHGWETSYYEELSMDKSAVRMERLNSGAPLLNAHGQWDLADVIGVVESARIEGGKGIATVRFSEREEVEPIFRDVKDGILRNISVGYQVHKWDRVQEEGSKYPIYRATDWEPQELSFVPVGFDAAAQVRSANPDSSIRPTRAAEDQEITVTEDEKKAEAERLAKIEQDKRDAATREAAAKGERQRAIDIRAAVKAAKLPDALAETLVAEGVEIGAARERVIAEMAKANPANPSHTPTVETGTDRKDHIREGMTNAILHRSNPDEKHGGVALSDKGREFRGMGVLEMARESLEAQGIKTRGMSKMDLAARALHSTSDFPLILQDVTSKSLRKQYDGAPRSFVVWAKRSTVPDFRPVKRLQLGDAPSLEKVNEAGEFKSGTMTEGKETYSILTYGKVIGFTRQALINDDIGAFTRVPELFGRAAADLESQIVYGILLNNGNLSDGVALFHATHGNLGTAGAPSITTLSELRKLMRKQKNLAGRAISGINPKTLIVGPDQETVAQQILNSDYVPTAQTGINPFSGNLGLVVEPLITNFNWFLAASPDQIDTVEYAYLEGDTGVTVETQMGFKVDGVEMKVRHDFGAGALDYRGLGKNAATS